VLRLRGGGGEPVILDRVFLSHGVASLPPNTVGAGMLTTMLAGPDRAVRRLTVRSSAADSATVSCDGPRPQAGEARWWLERATKMLRLEDDLTTFYELAAADPDLAWVAAGAGRMLAAPTVFEEVVKTVCTTNCSWAATERMVKALVDTLGTAGKDGCRAFPTAEQMAQAPLSIYREGVRAGYRARYLRECAQLVASGKVALEQLRDPELPDEEVERRLLSLPGVGPYAVSHLMLTALGRYHRLVLDSWTLPTWSKLSGAPPDARAVEARFASFGRYRGLAFWMYLTEHWTESPPE
jgi:3-methyladenine DNA glycosylase/8-oxoguanine DNA glycosylase